VINSICDGIIVGLGVSLLVGPLFFGLIQLSIEKSAWAGIIFAAGIWVSDILYVRVVQLGMGYLGDDPTFQLVFGIIGSVILFLFGIGIFVTPLKTGKLSTIGMKNALNWFSKGVAINVFNPFVLLLWVSIMGTIRTQPVRDQWIFVASMLSVVAAADVFKAVFAARIGAGLQEHRLMLIKRISGILIGAFGIILLVRTIVTVTHPPA
jgi:threonine/homoserine/homoserine lactone efflux protein